MKRTSPSYRLQMIKEVANRYQSTTTDPMADYIQTLLNKKNAHPTQKPEKKRIFSGLHFDEHAGGWVSDRWVTK
ncbi:hypothetical protein [Vibrio sp.]|uniref:hypothetical protein n=1 Tax=Vibrio sp. TaxID=678 RepID=UPI003D142623